MATKEMQPIQKTLTGLLKAIPPRNRDIISRRFGLQNGKRETLESIGKSYGITRERVRQIEEFTITQLAKSLDAAKDTEKYIQTAKAILAKEGGATREQTLFESFSGNAHYDATNAALVFLLTVDGTLVRQEDGDMYHAFWALSSADATRLKDVTSQLITALEKKKEVVNEKDLISFAQAQLGEGAKISQSYLSTVFSIAKDIDKNIFSEVGLVSWQEVKPRGVRDKAYLIMKREQAPRHFTNIAKLINVASFNDQKKVNIQTVHNELIKDQRFILVGRGMYALAEWGYKAGTVKEVLVDILKSHQKPLTKADLVAKVKDARMVKENTILLNLQDSRTFHKRDDGTYMLRKA